MKTNTLILLVEATYLSALAALASWMVALYTPF